VTWRHIEESAEQAALLQTGELDIVWNLSIDEIQRFGNDPDVQIFQTMGRNVIHLSMNMQHTPFTSPAGGMPYATPLIMMVLSITCLGAQR
jgi:ABC-type transport system substrate-binding protein